MKKQLLFGVLLLGSIFTANAQDSCATAVAVTPGTYTVGTINGTYGAGCWQTAATNSEWYSFTPASNGLATVRTDIEANDPDTDVTDTRFSVFIGTCTELTCYTGNDDVSDTDYRSAVTFPVEGGTTYYIAFDNRWLSTGFDFELSLEEISCFTPSGFAYSTTTPPTTTSVTLEWDAPVIGIPEGYEYEYGAQGYTQGEGIATGEVDAEMLTLSDLDPSTVYDLYVRTVCNDTDMSEWVGPISFNTVYEPAALDYSYGFEQTNFGLAGWSALTVNANGAAWGVYEGSEELPAQEGVNFAGAVGTGAVTNAWLFSRGVNLTSGEEVNVSYYARKFAIAGDGNINNLSITVGTDRTAAAQTTVLLNETNITNADWTQQSVSFTAPADGVYYFAFRCTSPAHTAANQGALLIDNVVFDSNLGANEVLASQFSVYPNPASNVINISNADNILVNGVEILDMNGRTVKSVKLDNVTEAQINVAELSAGMYLMNITSDNGTTTKKIVKN